MRVLVVEDNEKLARSIKSSLEQSGYSVDHAETAEDGERLATLEHFDLIVLDVMLPDRDGIELCRHLRRRRVATPILMLTVLGSVEDKVRGLDAGADDYLTKPFLLDELLARLRSLLRRSQSIEGAVLRSGDLEMKLHEHRVSRAGKPVKLSAKEFALLEFMMRNPGRLLTRAMISESVWDMNYESSSNVIEVYICALRRKIDRDPANSCIETVIGCGYRFNDRPLSEKQQQGLEQGA
ncbi:MAG: response regulator transcription factor [Planctomycetes bacterium]|nr:response regulator transcription factor [Planctomycetota bacterium]